MTMWFHFIMFQNRYEEQHVQTFLSNGNLCTSKALWAHFASVAIYQTGVKLTECLNINVVQILSSCAISGTWEQTGQEFLLTDDMEHTIKFSLKGHTSIWRENGMKYIDPTEAREIQILSRVLEHIMEMRLSTSKDTGLEPQYYQHPR